MAVMKRTNALYLWWIRDVQRANEKLKANKYCRHTKSKTYPAPTSNGFVDTRDGRAILVKVVFDKEGR